MPNAHLSVSLSLIERAATSLDTQVLDALLPLNFSSSPQGWSNELDGLFAERYRLRVQDRKDAIRVVAQEFRGTGRTDHLLQGGSDIVDCTGILHSMLGAVDVLTSPEFHPPGIQPPHLDRLQRLQQHSPTFRDAARVIVRQTSRWQDDFRGWQPVFLTLESREAVKSLLDSLPATIPDTYISQGRELIDQLVGGCNDRRAIIKAAHRLISYEEDPHPLLERLDTQRDTLPLTISSFMDVVKQLDDLPALHLPGQEFVARQFWDADSAFARLCLQLDSINRDISCLKRILDHFMSAANAANAAHATAPPQ